MVENVPVSLSLESPNITDGYPRRPVVRSDGFSLKQLSMSLMVLSTCLVVRSGYITEAPSPTSRVNSDQ